MMRFIFAVSLLIVSFFPPQHVTGTPDKLIRRLIEERVSLLDFGLLKMNLRLQELSETIALNSFEEPPGTSRSMRVTYDYARDRILISDTIILSDSDHRLAKSDCVKEIETLRGLVKMFKFDVSFLHYSIAPDGEINPRIFDIEHMIALQVNFSNIWEQRNLKTEPWRNFLTCESLLSSNSITFG